MSDVECCESDDDALPQPEKIPTSPPSNKTKYIALPFLCFIYFFIKINYEAPASLQKVIMSDLSYSTAKFSMLLSACFWPSALSFLGGLLADRYLGLNRGLIATVTVYCTGSLLYTIGMYTLNYPTIISGRILTGWGGEAISAIESSYIVLWFSDGGMNTAFALYCALAILEPAVIFQMSDLLYQVLTRDDQSLANRQLVLGHLSVFLLLCSVLLAVFSIIIIVLYKKSIRLKEIKVKKKPYPKIKSSKLDVSVTAKKGLPLNFWLLCVCGAAVQTGFYSFILMSQNFFVSFYKMNLDEVNNMVTYSSILSFFGLPLIGLVVDRTGKNLCYTIFSIVLAMVAHASMIVSSIYPMIPVMLLSVASFVFQGSFFKTIGQSVNEHQVTTAYGICYSLINAACGTGFMCVGLLTDTLGFRSTQFFFPSLFIVALIVNLVILYHERK